MYNNFHVFVCVCMRSYNFALALVLTNRVTFPYFTFLHQPIKPT